MATFSQGFYNGKFSLLLRRKKKLTFYTHGKKTKVLVYFIRERRPIMLGSSKGKKKGNKRQTVMKAKLTRKTKGNGDAKNSVFFFCNRRTLISRCSDEGGEGGCLF
uniref:Uncharacterized protein n=1 Tax=Cacopsylla melanoneura TaxID=428564 RepID=A0A8D8YD53_9HEMI